MNYSDIDAVAEAMVREALVTFASINPSALKVAEFKEAAEMNGDPAENFDNWLPLTLAGTSRHYQYTLSELNQLRITVRQVSDTNEIAKNVLRHYQDFIVGKHIQVDIVPIDAGDDPTAIATAKKDATVVKLLENWNIFTKLNKFDARCRNWVKRNERDGETIIRVFPNQIAPMVRFVDPSYLVSPDSDIPYGIEYDKKDAETPKRFFYQPEGESVPKPIKAEEIIFTTRNVDFGAPRGISSFWPVLSNLRRLEKVLVNSSVLAAIQAAITMVRKHTNVTQARVQAMVNKSGDGVQRTDPTTGRNIVGRRFRPGTILDAGQSVDYEFPSHAIDAGGFIKIAEHELKHIGANFVLPVTWLMADEPKEPLTPGSPTIAMFDTEQEALFEDIEMLFWVVQGMMGVNVETVMFQYDLLWNGKRLAVGKALDEARVDEILTRIGAQSPQTTSAKHGNNWRQERAGTIQHRLTRQPGEVMPGDAGNTNTADKGQDGTTKKGGGQRSSDGDGGNNAG